MELEFSIKITNILSQFEDDFRVETAFRLKKYYFPGGVWKKHTSTALACSQNVRAVEKLMLISTFFKMQVVLSFSRTWLLVD